MAFWNRKKKEKEQETVKVTCKCGAEYETECDGLGTRETGYKGRLSFYTHCEKCDAPIFFDEAKLLKGYVKRAYKNHIW